MLPAIKTQTMYVRENTEHTLFYFIKETLRNVDGVQLQILEMAKAGKYHYFIAVSAGLSFNGKLRTGIYVVEVREKDQRANKGTGSKTLRVKYVDFFSAEETVQGLCPSHVYKAATTDDSDPMIAISTHQVMTRYLKQLELINAAPEGSLFRCSNDLYTTYKFKSNVPDKVQSIAVFKKNNIKIVGTSSVGRLGTYYHEVELVDAVKAPAMKGHASNNVIRGFVFRVIPETYDYIFCGRELTTELALQLSSAAPATFAEAQSSYSSGSWME